MACYHPLDAWQQSKGAKLIFRMPLDVASGKYNAFQVPCGQCIGCKINRSKQWAVRCIHEASLHKHNSFVTLTYNNENLPAGNTLVKKDFQLFFKRLRRKFVKYDDEGEPINPIRYYMCGEYGEKLGRPHYHALIFGHDFKDKKLWEIRNGNEFYRSKELEKLWPQGFSSISDVNYKSSAYVARYIMKKLNGEAATNHYYRNCNQTGEATKLLPEYNGMSLKPAIGQGWYDRYKNDVYPSDNVIVDGKKMPTPKFYDSKLKNQDPDLYEVVKAKRIEKAESPKNKLNNTPERLKIRKMKNVIDYQTCTRTLK